MTTNSLGLDNLKFFTGEGKEIIMKKQFSASWEIIPHTFVYPAFYRNPSGHFEVTRPKDLTGLFTSENAVPDGLGHIVSAPVVLTPGRHYSITATPDDLEDFIILRDKYGVEKGRVTPKTSGSLVIVKIICSGTGLITVVQSDDIDIVVKYRNEIDRFTVRVPAGDETREMTEFSGTSIVVVDEPGQVNPVAQFARRPHDRDYIYDHTLLTSENGIVVNYENDAMYREITDDASNYWTLTDIYDILFFSYKVTVDEKDYVEGNTIRITLNDGKDIFTVNYPLADFLRCTYQTAVEDNLETYSSYDTDSDTDLTENLEDLMSYDSTKSGNLYGMRNGLFAEVPIVNYKQYTETDFKELSKLILYIHKHPEKTDTEVLGMLHSFFKEHRIQPEWWSSPEVLDIVRERDEYGELVPWPEQENEDEPVRYEEVLAQRLLDYITYGPDKEVLQSETVARYIIDYNIPEDQYPYVRYYGTVYQDKASAGLIDAQTIVIVTDNGSSVQQRYSYPVVKDSDSNSEDVEYRMHFRFQSDSEMFFVSMVDDSQMKKSDTLYALTPEEINTTGNVRETNALHFTVGFETKEEGCYENSLGMFIMNTENQEEDFFIGLLQFRTEVEDEDERYRTLFTNFGIPDPIVYPNIFKEQDPQEEGTDWRVVNRKSKELFLEYDQIFPYAGTYRALFNAIRFLGYQDLIFKEWYKLKDSNDHTKYVAIQNYDTNGGKSIKNVIKSYGINYEDYDRYTKLNRLSMIYHLQEIDDAKSEDKRKPKAFVFKIAGQEVGLPSEGIPYKMPYYSALRDKFKGEWNEHNVIVYRNDGGRLFLTLTKIDEHGREVADDTKYVTQQSTLTHIVTSTRHSGRGIQAVIPEYCDFDVPTPFIVDETGRHEYNYSYEDISAVENIYEYRNEEVLIKLYSVKKWLEDYITGVNCYISDINGEYIVLERIKTVGYVTGGEVKDITSEGHFTPHCEIRKTYDASTSEYVQDVFEDSSINIQCSLNEFRSVTFEDYADYPIERFIKWNYNGTSDEHSPLTVRTVIDGSTVDMPVYISAPINALTVADEYQYSLRLENPSSGSLYEFADKDCLDNPIVIQDGEIKFMDDSQKYSRISNRLSRNSSNECPVIQITKGNLRCVSGDWAPESNNNNVVWSITTKLVIEEGYEKAQTYVIMERKSDGLTARFKGAVNLSPMDEAAEFLYTSDNKWQLPMFIITGYVPTNQLRSDYISGGGATRISTLFRNQKDVHYVLDIVEGRIMFRNHHVASEEKMCKGAEIEFKFTDAKEQEINIDYTWESERVPVYDFDTDAFLADVLGKEVSSEEFFNKIDENIVENTSVNIPVNRLGDYVVSVKAYDAYNNIYTNESDDKCSVKVLGPSIEVILNQKNASNGEWFYKESPDGTLLTQEEKIETLDSLESEPVYPVEYKIYSGSHDVDNHIITYDNITYALDTPKAEDYLTLTNMTEAAYEISINGNQATILMKSSNPGKQNIFNEGGQVTLCVYDELDREILLESISLDIVGKPVKPTRRNTSDVIYPDGKIVVDNVPSELAQYVRRINDDDDTLNLYVINATVCDISEELIGKIEVDTENRTTFIPVLKSGSTSFSPMFYDDAMIKLCTTYVTTDRRITSRQNGTAFRVLESTYIVEDDVYYHGYRIDGIVNSKFVDELKNRDAYMKTSENDVPTIGTISMSISPLHIAPVEYILRVNDDAIERSYLYGDSEFYTMRTSVQYNPYQLMLDAIIDDTYSVSDSHFDHDVLKEMWVDSELIHNAWDDTDDRKVPLYVYHDTPVTVGTDRYLIVRPCSKVSQIEDGYRVKWRWISYGIEDKTNWKDNNGNMSRILLFESTNRVLSVTPAMLGSQSVELHCMDKYGNVISNTGGGNIMVDSEQYTEKVHTLV